MAAPTAREPTFGNPFSLATTATAVMDARGLVIGWNRAAERLLGFSPDEVLGKPARKFFVPLDGSPLIDPDAPLEQWGRTRVLRHRDGRPVRAVLYIPSLGPPTAATAWVIVAIAADEMERWAQDQAVLAGLFSQSPIALTVYAADGRVRWFNAAVERLGLDLEDWVDRAADELPPIGEIISPHLRDLPFDEIIGRVFRTGEPVVDMHYRGLIPSDPAHQRVWSCSYFRLEDARGRMLGVCESAFDITDRYEAQQRLALLGRSSMIGRTLDVTRTAEELIAVTVPDFADAAWVDVTEPVLTGGDVQSWNPDRPLRPAARSSPPPTADSDAPWPPEEETSGARRIVLPLDAGHGHGPLGQVSLLRVPPREPFNDAELALARELVSHTAVCIDNARRYAHERATALLLQRNLLPQSLPVPPAVEVAHHYAPTVGPLGVGGDWYDVIPLSSARVGLVVGDVVGHGLHAAATMGRLRTTVRALAGLDLAPEELLTRLDDLVAQARVGLHPAADPDEDPAIGARCLYAVYDPVGRRCAVAGAGHLPPLLVTADGSAEPLDLPVGLPLGVGGMPYESTEFELAENSLLVLFTDGLVTGKERPDPEAGVQELCRNLSRHAGLSPQAACGLIAAWHTDDPAPDDAVLLVARVHALTDDQVADHRFSSEPTEVARARSWARERLAGWGLERLSPVVELVVSELVTNAILHGRPPVLLRLLHDADRVLICEVSDAGHTSPHLTRAGPDDEGGRGLFLVAQVTGRWGTRYTPEGKTIWTEIPTAAD